jgi:hypothetical protein
VPNLKSFESVLDLFTFCNLMVMANILDLRTYQPATRFSGHDVNSIPAKERYEMAYARGRCWDILGWFFHRYELYDNETGLPIDGFKEVAMRYLAHQASMIIEFKKKADKNLKEYGSPLTLKALSHQMKLCFQNYSDIPEILPADPESVVSLAFVDKCKYGVKKLDAREPYDCKRVFLRGCMCLLNSFPFSLKEPS